MTREEALFKAKDVLDEATAYEDAVCYVTGDDREWLETAIKALEQKVCEYWCVDGYCRRSEVPKIGHWGRKTKVDAYDIAGVKTWGIKCQCDRCCFTTIVVEDFGYYKYCPNCGCRMEGEE